MPSKKSPNPTDIHVGSRVRLRRMMLGVSQEKLAEGLGITFQQVHKYEKGTNRLSASRLQDVAGILSVPVSFFFEGQPDGQNNVTAEVHTLAVQSPGAMKLLQVFNSLDTQGQQGLLRIAETIDGMRAPEEQVLEAA
ncbi:helix-turn-helix domain-containing protein [Roseibium alexandrii]|uniref:helix-turn-helix domain-containing protein n=1 Tax=Roseibium alexandrii TaxID=388408 RepID=UPI00375107BA